MWALRDLDAGRLNSLQGARCDADAWARPNGCADVGTVNGTFAPCD